MQDNTYNGWRNYATWRIQLELVGDYVSQTVYDDDETRDRWLKAELHELADELEEYISDVFDTYQDNNGSTNNPLRSYADAFIDEVDWRELAEHAQLNAKEALEYSEDK